MKDTVYRELLGNCNQVRDERRATGPGWPCVEVAVALSRDCSFVAGGTSVMEHAEGPRALSAERHWSGVGDSAAAPIRDGQ